MGELPAQWRHGGGVAGDAPVKRLMFVGSCVVAVLVIVSFVLDVVLIALTEAKQELSW